MKRNQTGVTLIGMLIVLVVVGFAAYIGMRLFPMYQEYYSLKMAAKGLAQEPGAANMDPSRLRELLFQRLDARYSDVKPADIAFDRIGSGWNLHVKYEVRTALIFNLDAVGKFELSQDITQGSGGQG